MAPMTLLQVEASLMAVLPVDMFIEWEHWLDSNLRRLGWES